MHSAAIEKKKSIVGKESQLGITGHSRSKHVNPFFKSENEYPCKKQLRVYYAVKIVQMKKTPILCKIPGGLKTSNNPENYVSNLAHAPKLQGGPDVSRAGTATAVSYLP